MSISRAGIGNTTQACAACKHQRRKCASDCIFKPYFPHDKQRQFLNAHKLFGVSNISKIIKTLNPTQRDEAMSSIITQSDIRAADPIRGCYGLIIDLQTQLEIYKAELDLVLHHLSIYRSQFAQQHQLQLHEGYNTTRLICDGTLADAVNNNIHFNSGDVTCGAYLQELQQPLGNGEGSSDQLQDPGTWCTLESVSSLPNNSQHLWME